MLVSGTRVLFLDPSGTYLPFKQPGNIKRTKILMTLETCQLYEAIAHYHAMSADLGLLLQEVC